MALRSRLDYTLTRPGVPRKERRASPAELEGWRSTLEAAERVVAGPTAPEVTRLDEEEQGLEGLGTVEAARDLRSLIARHPEAVRHVDYRVGVEMGVGQSQYMRRSRPRLQSCERASWANRSVGAGR